MAASDYEIATGWLNAYLAKKKKPSKKVYPVVAPQPFENTSGADMDILTSILRREQFPQKIYNYRGGATTIQPKTINGVK